jgi:hypothetical protein
MSVLGLRRMKLDFAKNLDFSAEEVLGEVHGIL